MKKNFKIKTLANEYQEKEIFRIFGKRAFFYIQQSVPKGFGGIWWANSNFTKENFIVLGYLLHNVTNKIFVNKSISMIQCDLNSNEIFYRMYKKDICYNIVYEHVRKLCKCSLISEIQNSPYFTIRNYFFKAEMMDKESSKKYVIIFHDFFEHVLKSNEIKGEQLRVFFYLINKMNKNNLITVSAKKDSENLGIQESNFSRAITLLVKDGFLCLLRKQHYERVFEINPLLVWKGAKEMHIPMISVFSNYVGKSSIFSNIGLIIQLSKKLKISTNALKLLIAISNKVSVKNICFLLKNEMYEEFGLSENGLKQSLNVLLERRVIIKDVYEDRYCFKIHPLIAWKKNECGDELEDVKISIKEFESKSSFKLTDYLKDLTIY